MSSVLSKQILSRVLWCTLFFSLPFFVSADTAKVNDLKRQIEERNNAIAQIEQEIAEYQESLQVVGQQKKTLENEVKSLDLSRSRIAADVRVTENRIAAANLTIEQLSLQIEDNTSVIDTQRETVAQSLRELHRESDQTFVETLFSSRQLSEMWVAQDELSQFERALRSGMEVLRDTNVALEDDRSSIERKNRELVALRTDLANQQRALDINRQEKNSLLSITKNQESEYQKLLNQKIAARKAFEAELASLESELKIAIDPNLLPRVGSGVLKWPFSTTYLQRCGTQSKVFGNPYCITQYFGNTAFATKNPQIYSGGGHNGVDFGMPSGTPLEAALAGTVVGTGNTDAVRGCYSYGKWVLIRHNNGISTMYAHLSAINVAPGDVVSTGTTIGYSGNTGYSTGPHLHFTVFASQGVQIMTLGEYRGATTPCANASMPVASLNAYLNPLSYL